MGFQAMPRCCQKEYEGWDGACIRYEVYLSRFCPCSCVQGFHRTGTCEHSFTLNFHRSWMRDQVRRRRTKASCKPSMIIKFDCKERVAWYGSYTRWFWKICGGWDIKRRVCGQTTYTMASVEHQEVICKRTLSIAYLKPIQASSIPPVITIH